jgi:hypothetical protein
MGAYGGPELVYNGLELLLDASNRKSYPGTGTTWFDLSGKGKNFTLDGSGITWNSDGYFSLADGGATYAGATSTSTTSTVVFWMRTTDLQALFWEGDTGGFYLGAYSAGNKEYYNSCGSPQFLMDTVDTANIYDFFPNNIWRMIEFKNTDLSTWTVSKFNKYSGFTFGNGAVGSILIYNRNLTAQESTQNYYAFKSKFGK